MAVLTDLVEYIESLPPNQPCTEEQWTALANAIPDPKPESLSDLYTSIVALESTTPKVRLVAILACLKTKPSLEGDQETAKKLADYAATLIAPCARPAGPSGDDEDDDSGAAGADTTPEDYEDTVQRVREAASYGLEIIRFCTDEYSSARLSQDTLLTLISYTTSTLRPAPAGNMNRPRRSKSRWLVLQKPLPEELRPAHPCVTTPNSQLASELLATQRLATQRLASTDAFVTTVLEDYLRPLFSRSRPSAVTASGRKAEFPQEQDISRGLEDETGAVKPWKFVDHRAISVFIWAVCEASEDFISKKWPLFIPVLLTLLDDGTTRVRRAGLLILPTFLEKFPDHILASTGLASVFEDAVFPTLHFLPPLTPEAESVELLEPAFSSLLVLAGKLDQRVKTGQCVSRMPRARLLDRVLRDGVFAGYSHAKEYPRVVCLLFIVSRDIVGMGRGMGLHAVKHLKDLVPMHCDALKNPFAVATPQILWHALFSLAGVMASCWPCLELAPYDDEITNALIVCFLNVHDDPESEGQLKVHDDPEEILNDPGSEGKLKRVYPVLLQVGELLGYMGPKDDGNGGRHKDKLASLIAKEPALKILFGTDL